MNLQFSLFWGSQAWFSQSHLKLKQESRWNKFLVMEENASPLEAPSFFQGLIGEERAQEWAERGRHFHCAHCGLERHPSGKFTSFCLLLVYLAHAEGLKNGAYEGFQFWLYHPPKSLGLVCFFPPPLSLSFIWLHKINTPFAPIPEWRQDIIKTTL